MTRKAYENAKRFKSVHTSYGKHMCNKRLRYIRRLARQGKTPDEC